MISGADTAAEGLADMREMREKADVESSWSVGSSRGLIERES